MDNEYVIFHAQAIVIKETARCLAEIDGYEGGNLKSLESSIIRLQAKHNNVRKNGSAELKKFFDAPFLFPIGRQLVIHKG